MRSEYALQWLVCAGVAWRAAAAAAAAAVASTEDDETAGEGAEESPLRVSPLVTKEDWLSEYTQIRKPLFESKTNLDCFSAERKDARPYPHDCYGHDFAFNADSFWQFWQEVHGDLQYTFDFVLYEEFFEHGGRDKVTTSFWLLIAYLKHLAIKIPDPNDIAVGNLLAEKQKIYEKFKMELNDLNAQAQKKAAELDDIVRNLKY